LRPLTAQERITVETAERLARGLWVALVAKDALPNMFNLVDELLDTRTLDDDDDEQADGADATSFEKRNEKF
jgi:hypothetical protein